MLEHTNDLICLLDMTDAAWCVYASSSYQSVLGYDPALLIGQPGTLLVHPDDLAIVREQWSLLSEHSNSKALIRYQHADASWRTR